MHNVSNYVGIPFYIQRSQTRLSSIRRFYDR